MNCPNNHLMFLSSSPFHLSSGHVRLVSSLGSFSLSVILLSYLILRSLRFLLFQDPFCFTNVHSSCLYPTPPFFRVLSYWELRTEDIPLLSGLRSLFPRFSPVNLSFSFTVTINATYCPYSVLTGPGCLSVHRWINSSFTHHIYPSVVYDR